MPKLLLLLIVAALLLSGCEYLPSLKSKKKDALARVHNKYLPVSEIEGLLSPVMSPQDSAVLVSNYINNWIRKELLLNQAEKSLSQREKDFSKQLEDYRNSLIIYEYESSIVRQQLDTVVSMFDIQAYYNQHKENFELKENIVKVDFVQIPADAKEQPRLRRLWQNSDLRSRTELEKYCIQNGLNYSLFDDSWVFFSDLMKQVPITAYNQENFLRFNRNVEARDSLYIYLVEFKDFKIKESVAPLSMHQDNIRKIIVNRRKLELIQKLQNDIFENGLINNYFEIFEREGE